MIMYSIENANGTLESILLKVRADKARQEDYVAPTRDLQFQTKIVEDGPNQPQIVLERNGGMPTKVLDVNDVAFQQISSKANLHVNDTRRLVENYGQEFDPLMNRIWEKEDKAVMVRTYADDVRPERGLARAFVSDSFKTFDNHHFLEASLPQLMESDAQWQVVNGTITEKKLYLRLRSLVHEGEAKLNDPMALGLLLSNSEVGHGAINVQQLVYTLMCLNGMETQNKTRSTHLQSARGEDSYGLLTDEAKAADSQALSLRLRDVTASFASRESFDVVLEKMRNAHEDGVNAKATDAISALTGILKLPKAAESKILDGLMATLQQPGYNDGRLSRATLVNSVTAVANQPETHEDNKQDWMRLGAKVLELPRAAWRQVSEAEPVALAA
tara:strand:- start:654 stop:1814 length:1161 start_codon:yes stop_codon:yes gene_type:complete